MSGIHLQCIYNSINLHLLWSTYVGKYSKSKLESDYSICDWKIDYIWLIEGYKRSYMEAIELFDMYIEWFSPQADTDTLMDSSSI